MRSCVPGRLPRRNHGEDDLTAQASKQDQSFTGSDHLVARGYRIMFPDVIDLLAAAEALDEYWSPAIVAQVNDQFVKVAKLHGEFVWHCHQHEDELFLVLRGKLKIQYENDRTVSLNAGSMHVVPSGFLHNPVAEEECLIALIETVTTKHTGDLDTPLTKSLEEQQQANPQK